MKRRKLVDSVVIIAGFVFAYYGRRYLAPHIPLEFTSVWIKMLYLYLWWLIPPVLVTGFLYGFRNLFRELGLARGLVPGLIFALLSVSPMLISSALAGTIDPDLPFASLMQSTVFAGLLEEFLFRGFLFGLLFRKAGWGFFPAALLGAVIFGFGHLYQGNSLAQSAGIFLLTGMGAVWFAWLYIEWEENLWVPVCLHILMNLSWTLFSMSDNALGGWFPNVFRGITIALTILITIIYCKKRGLRVFPR